MNPCELCESLEGIKREDNIYVCNKCNRKYPLKKKEIEDDR